MEHHKPTNRFRYVWRPEQSPDHGMVSTSRKVMWLQQYWELPDLDGMKVGEWRDVPLERYES
jgi:hypothetical protein